jgi:hypothetical protein
VDATRTYYLGSRVWWSLALLLGPVLGAMAAGLVGAVALTGLLVLPAFVVFDTDRRWWPDEVRRLPGDAARSRAEVRSLTLWGGLALIAGILLAVLRASA